MLIGEYSHTFDDKNRVSLPAKFRKEIGKHVVIAPGIDRCLFVFTDKGWKEFAQRVSRPDSSSVLQTDNRNFNRLIVGRATETDIDSIGRILVPDNLREYAGLKTKVVLIGVMNRVEIWDSDAWTKYRKEFEKKTDVLAEKMSSAGII